jgi:hypothetical protein
MAEVGSRRILRVMEAFAARPPGPPERRLCSAASKLLDAAVGVSFGASDDLLDSGLQTVCATEGGRDGEALQAELGEGPSYTAHRSGQANSFPRGCRTTPGPGPGRLRQCRGRAGARARDRIVVRTSSAGTQRGARSWGREDRTGDRSKSDAHRRSSTASGSCGWCGQSIWANARSSTLATCARVSEVDGRKVASG